MLTNKAQLQCTVNDKIGLFFCDQDTPIPVAKEMLFQFQKFLGHIEDAANKEQEEKKENKVEELPQE